MIRVRDVVATAVGVGMIAGSLYWAAKVNAAPQVACLSAYEGQIAVTICDTAVRPDGTFTRCVDATVGTEYAWECREMSIPTTQV